MQISLVGPVTAQCRAVNAAAVSLFLTHLALPDHLSALRRYLLLQCGEFAQALGDALFGLLSDPARTARCAPAALLRDALVASKQVWGRCVSM